MKIVLETEPRNLPALDITLSINGLKSCCSIIGRATSGDAGLCRAATLAGAPPPVFTPEFLQGYADELQMLAQQYADDKEKVALLKALWQYAEEIV